MTSPSLLSVENIQLAFGGISALDGVSFHANAGAVTGVIGPNGAGKTSLFNCLSGLYRPNAGRVLLRGKDLSRFSPARRAILGMARTFQHTALFESLSVLDNVKLGATAALSPTLLGAVVPLPRDRALEDQAEAFALEALDWVGIAGLAPYRVNELNFATRKQVELARAIASHPKLIMLDEPAGGLNHEAVQHLASQIRRLVGDKGIGVLLIEHHMNLVMDISDHVVVLNFGRTICQGPPALVRRDAAVVQAYLGAS